jgi:hypothetical protein
LTTKVVVVRRRFGWYEWVSLALAAVIGGAAIAQAIREHSWQPIFTVAWLPAVLVTSLGTRRTTGRCWPRTRRRSDP